MVEGITKATTEKRDRSGDAGVAAALARLRSMGELSRKLNNTDARETSGFT